MTQRRVFFSFHYERDAWRAGQVRNIGVLEGNEPVSDNSWEEVKRGGDSTIKRWIDNELSRRSCVVVLIGNETADRKWVNYEITKGWNSKKGVVGIYIHNLKDRFGYQSPKGRNPFDRITFKSDGRGLSHVVKAYDPPYTDSQQVYAWIERYLSGAVEEAIQIRNRYR